MRELTYLRAGALALAALAVAAPVRAAEETHIPGHEWSFEGPFGTFERDELQRGWQVYQEVCSTCHSMKHLAFRSLGDETGPAFPEEQVKAIAASFEVPTLDDDGEPTLRPATPADKIVGPFQNEKQAAAANNGAIPPDLSLITKARAGCHGILTQLVEGACGPEYVYAVLTGYTEEPPEGFEVGDGLTYNKYFPGHQIAMGQPLFEDSAAYQDETEASIEQQAHDVVAFLTWAAEPKMIERKSSGMRNVIYLSIFAVLLWYSNRKLWKPIKEGGQA